MGCLLAKLDLVLGPQLLHAGTSFKGLHRPDSKLIAAVLSMQHTILSSSQYIARIAQCM